MRASGVCMGATRVCGERQVIYEVVWTVTSDNSRLDTRHFKRPDSFRVRDVVHLYHKPVTLRHFNLGLRNKARVWQDIRVILKVPAASQVYFWSLVKQRYSKSVRRRSTGVFAEFGVMVVRGQ